MAATGVDVSRVSCQAFADAQAKRPIGGPATAANDGAVFTKNRNHPVTISAIICSTSAQRSVGKRRDYGARTDHGAGDFN